MTASPSSHEKGLRAKEVCQQMGIQPYVLKFWESEFPQLGRRVGSKRIYHDESLSIVSEIRRLVDEDRLTLSEARGILDGLFPPREEASRKTQRAATGEPSQAKQPALQTSLFLEAETRIRELESKLARSEEKLAERQPLEERLKGAELRATRAQDELELLQAVEANRAILEERVRELEESLRESRKRVGADETAAAEVQERSRKERHESEHAIEALGQEVERLKGELLQRQETLRLGQEQDAIVDELREELDRKQEEIEGLSSGFGAREAELAKRAAHFEQESRQQRGQARTGEELLEESEALREQLAAQLESLDEDERAARKSLAQELDQVRAELRSLVDGLGEMLS